MTLTGEKVLKIADASIQEVINSQAGGRKVKYFRPTKDVDLIRYAPVVFDTAPEGVRPIVRVVMEPGSVIPFHVHKGKRKVYVSDGNGTIVVWVYGVDGTTPRTHTMGSTNPVVEIHPGQVHAVYCVDAVGDMASFVVIPSKDDPKDIEWEPSADELCSTET